MNTKAPDFGALRAQHAARILEEARRIQEFSVHVINRVESGHAATTGMYLADIVASGQRGMLAVATIEGLGVLDPDPATPGTRDEDR